MRCSFLEFYWSVSEVTSQIHSAGYVEILHVFGGYEYAGLGHAGLFSFSLFVYEQLTKSQHSWQILAQLTNQGIGSQFVPTYNKLLVALTPADRSPKDLPQKFLLVLSSTDIGGGH